MSFRVGDQPPDDLGVEGFVEALKLRCAANLQRQAVFDDWLRIMGENDICTVQELKLLVAQVATELFAQAKVGAGAQVMVKLALAPLVDGGWCWNSAQGQNVPASAKRISPTWNTEAKYTQSKYTGDIRQFTFPVGSFDEWPPCEVLSYSDMVAVGSRAWLLINTHPKLKGGGITRAAATRVAELLSERYKELDPIGKHKPRKKGGDSDVRCSAFDLNPL